MTRLHAALLMLAILVGRSEAKTDSICREGRFDVSMPPFTGEPFVTLELDGRQGPWLVDFGATSTTIFANPWTAFGPGQSARLSGFTFPGVSPGPRTYQVVEGGQFRRGIGLTQGTIGTDLLKDVVTELHFEDASHPYVIFSSAACQDAPGGDEGFLVIDQRDFFSAEPASRASDLPNVPIAFIELEERSTDTRLPGDPDRRRVAKTWSQIDTGYGDTSWPYSVDINEAYLRQLKQTVPSLALAGVVKVAGCGNEVSTREVFVAPGWRLNVVSEHAEPRPAIPFDSFHFVVKPADSACGGIGSFSAPAAQLGSTFLRAFGTTIFKPATAEVWIKAPTMEKR